MNFSVGGNEVVLSWVAQCFLVFYCMQSSCWQPFWGWTGQQFSVEQAYGIYMGLSLTTYTWHRKLFNGLANVKLVWTDPFKGKENIVFYNKKNKAEEKYCLLYVDLFLWESFRTWIWLFRSVFQSFSVTLWTTQLT